MHGVKASSTVKEPEAPLTVSHEPEVGAFRTWEGPRELVDEPRVGDASHAVRAIQHPSFLSIDGMLSPQ